MYTYILQNTILIIRQYLSLAMLVFSLSLTLISCMIIPSMNYCTESISCFQKSLFKFNFPPQNIYELHTITNYSNSQNFDPLNVVAYGDLNNDLKTDFITLEEQATNDGLNQLGIYVWSNQNISYILAMNIKPTLCNPQAVYLYDINFDGFLDITIYGTLSTPEEPYENCLVPFIHQTGSIATFLEGSLYKTKSSSEPTIIAYGQNNSPNSITGLLLFSTIKNKRLILKYDSTFENSYLQISWNKTFQSTQAFQSTPFSNPHWNSFLDVTGDCRSDVILVDNAMNIQLWINNGNTFSYNNTWNYGDISSLSFADINYDGSPDMIIAYKNSIEVAYNEKNVQGSSQFCCKDCKQFELKDPQVIIKFEQNYQLQKQTMHISDIDINGYPDFLIKLTNSTQGNSKQFPIIYLNENAEKFTSDSNYKFIVMENGQQVYLEGNIISVSYLDILENGILDILVVLEDSASKHHLYSFYNNILEQNSFFIKGYGATGINSSSGCQINGASFYWLNSIGDGIRTTYQPQIIQSAYNALQLPYAYSGIGRANNYVQSFTLGVFGSMKSWTPIIPNSQLAVYASSTEVSDWGIRVFVLPTQSLVYVVIVSAVILLIMGLVLAGLKYKNHKKKQQPLMMDFIN